MPPTRARIIVQRSQGILGAPCILQGRAQVQPERGRLGIGRDGLPKGLRGLAVTAPLHEDHAHHVKRGRIARRSLQRLAQQGDCLGGVTAQIFLACLRQQMANHLGLIQPTHSPETPRREKPLPHANTNSLVG